MVLIQLWKSEHYNIAETEASIVICLYIIYHMYTVCVYIYSVFLYLNCLPLSLSLSAFIEVYLHY